MADFKIIKVIWNCTFFARIELLIVFMCTTPYCHSANWLQNGGSEYSFSYLLKNNVETVWYGSEPFIHCAVCWMSYIKITHFFKIIVQLNWLYLPLTSFFICLILMILLIYYVVTFHPRPKFLRVTLISPDLNFICLFKHILHLCIVITIGLTLKAILKS